MSIIEQATKRLEELRRAGIDIPLNPGVRVEPTGDIGAARAATTGDAPVGVAYPPAVPVAPVEHREPAAPAEPVKAPTRNAVSQYKDIDLQRLASEGYLTSNDKRSELTEELRAVKRPIIEHAQEARESGVPNGNLILVTSALPGEGKTYSAINLAISIAMEVDHSVLLVDADVVHASVMTRLGLEAEIGMLDVLTKPELDLSDALIRTNIPKLTLLPAGSATAKSTELLASGAMERMLAELAVRYSDRIVIFDGPPLLVTSEARVLAARMGQVLMVVEANRTPQASVREAFDCVEDCETVWCVLNKSTAERVNTSYGRQSYRQG